jgi:hypothetical protein
MIAMSDTGWLLRARAMGRHTMVAAILSMIGVTAAWDTLNPARSTPLTVLYVGAADCAPCHAWQRGDGSIFLASAEFTRVVFREVKSPSLRDVLNDSYWPDDLRAYRDQLGRDAGVPLWIVIGDGRVLERGFGASQWRSVILPRIKALIR